MGTLGAINVIANRGAQLHEMRLANMVATVDRTEAEQGAAHNDLVRISQREREDVVPFERYLSRVSKSALLLKKNNEQKKKDTETEENCPIAKARAQSEVGENAPLSWLIADQMGGQTEVPQNLDSRAEVAEFPSAEPAATFTPQPLFQDSSGTLLEQEWLLSPAG